MPARWSWPGRASRVAPERSGRWVEHAARPWAPVRGWPAALAVFRGGWQRSAPLQLLRGRWETGVEVSRCLSLRRSCAGAQAASREGGRRSPRARSGIGLSLTRPGGDFVLRPFKINRMCRQRKQAAAMLRRKGGVVVRVSNPGGRDCPALCRRLLPWPRAHPFTCLCQVGAHTCFVSGRWSSSSRSGQDVAQREVGACWERSILVAGLWRVR